MQQSDEMRKKEIENRVYMARKNAHLSQMKLAEMAEMSNNSISNIMLGKQVYNSDKLQQITDVLSVPLRYLLNNS